MLRRRINRKSALALGLVITSFIAALLLAGESNRSQSVWQIARTLPAGKVLTGNDLRLIRVMLGVGAGSYFEKSQSPVGSRLRTPVSEGDLLAKSAVDTSGTPSDMSSVPVKVARNDFPSDLQVNQRIDLFALPINQTNSDFSAVAVASGIAVESIDQRSKDYGSDVGIVLSVPTRMVYQVIANLVSARVVVVRDGN